MTNRFVDAVRFVMVPAVIVAALLVSTAAPAQMPAARNQASVVYVGHSLINYDMPSYVGSIAASKGMSYSKAVQVIIGSPLRVNYENCRRATATYSPPSAYTFSCDAIDTGNFDTVVLTEANNTLASHRQFNNTDEYVSRYLEQLLRRNPSGRTLLFTTWEALPTYGADWGARQAADLAGYEDVARRAAQLAAARGVSGSIEVIPVDIALRDLLTRIDRGEIPGVSRSTIFLDDVHMTNAGNYFVACVVFAAIYNRSPEGASETVPSPYPGQPPLVDLSGGAGRTLQRLAWDTVTAYRTGGAVARPKPPGSLQVR